MSSQQSMVIERLPFCFKQSPTGTSIGASIHASIYVSVLASSSGLLSLLPIGNQTTASAIKVDRSPIFTDEMRHETARECRSGEGRLSRQPDISLAWLWMK
ncbi:hypothetical protein VXM60_20900 [Shewanella khirikhana]|uniref:hypothetical protein n=1 Tax=Shewanella khirikhana TaxID=1965282 RepID=UPI0030D3528B